MADLAQKDLIVEDTQEEDSEREREKIKLSAEQGAETF